MQCQCRMNKSQKAVHHLNIWFWATMILPEGQLPFLATGCKEGSRFTPVFPNLFFLSHKTQRECAGLLTCCTSSETTTSFTKHWPFQLIYFPIAISSASKVHVFQLGIQYVITLYLGTFSDCKSVTKTQIMFFVWGLEKSTSGLL